MKPPPAGLKRSTPKASRWFGFTKWPRARALRLTVTYRGGAESWWLIEARGRHGAFPGHRALEDVMAEICQDG